jgi:hypothetical protein
LAIPLKSNLSEAFGDGTLGPEREHRIAPQRSEGGRMAEDQKEVWFRREGQRSRGPCLLPEPLALANFLKTAGKGKTVTSAVSFSTLVPI